MTSTLAKCLAASALLLGLVRAASAGVPAVDLFHSVGVPDTGGYSTAMGPCYCDQPVLTSPLLLLQPGTYDFGTVREYWVQSGYTPDGGMDQPNFYLLFSPVEAPGDYPFIYPTPVTYVDPDQTASCSQGDVACNARYADAWSDFDLVYTVPPGQNAAQVSLIGRFLYTSPVPEPLACASMALGLALVASLARRRRPIPAAH